jgi:hypothetical protein
VSELEEYRRKLLDRLVAAVQDFRSACVAVKDLRAAAAEGDWNVHQLAAHTRDVDRDAYGLRIRRTLAEDNPLLRNYDPDDWLQNVYKADEPLGKILDELSAGIAEEVEMLRSLPAAGWSRTSRQETMGEGFTLQVWVERPGARRRPGNDPVAG